MRIAGLQLLLVMLSLSASVVGFGADGHGKARLGQDTSRINGPLKPNGMPDYFASLAEHYSKGVTPENNAVVPILHALGPEAFGWEAGADELNKLGVTLREGAAYFVDFDQEKPDAAKEYAAALKSPWSAKDHPELAKWLQANKGPLDTFTQASKRSRFYHPPKPGPDEAPTMGLMIGGGAGMRSAAESLMPSPPIRQSRLKLGDWVLTVGPSPTEQLLSTYCGAVLSKANALCLHDQMTDAEKMVKNWSIHPVLFNSKPAAASCNNAQESDIFNNIAMKAAMYYKTFAKAKSATVDSDVVTDFVDGGLPVVVYEP